MMAKTDMTTLSTCLKTLEGRGYNEHFVVDETKLKSLEAAKTYAPKQLKVVNFYRFESETDPSESSILYTIETQDGHKGTLVDGYGLYADERIDAYLKQIGKLIKQQPELD